MSLDRRGFLKLGAAGMAVAGLLGYGRTAFADEEREYGHGQRGIVSFFIEHKEELGLTPDQVSRLKAVREGFRKTAARIGADLETAYEQFHDLMQEDEIKLAAVEAASKKIESLESERRIEFAKAIAEGKKALSKDQLKKAKELRQKSMEQRRS
ncbi:MAG: periplasmic heavy metal sensor [Nitrospirae bacterium]|nr:periplasmic heavy metal sensor [Nitrospirota bacterium]